jgi:hypothetical protein
MLLGGLEVLRNAMGGFGRSVAPRTTEHPAPRLRPGPALAALLVLGLLVRLYLVFFTQGTYDVRIWDEHAHGVREHGLVGYYHENRLMNHPPLAGLSAAGLSTVADATGIPFRVLLRLPFALFDAATALLVLWLLRDRSWRFVALAGYWLHPLAVIFSAFHGNTDSALPFFVLSSIALLASGRVGWAGMVLGASLWIKLPGVLAVPALFLVLPSWPARLRFLLGLGAVGAVTYLPVLLQDPLVLWRNVFAYRGQMIQTTAGVPVWGMRMFLPAYHDLPELWRNLLYEPIHFFLTRNSWCALGSLVLLAWLRRHRRGGSDLVWTVTGCFTIMYGFSLYWSFQYFAWALPLWILLGTRYGILASLVAAAYIYLLYAFVCGNPWLLGEWDFVGHPTWPGPLVWTRGAGQLFFYGSAWGFLVLALIGFVRRLRAHSPGTPPPPED